ncbi:MAG TPA: nucleotidyltransferase family protein [Gemmatimonadales bacterium]|nr:nucleotidyltransferase family protein [Gemmatimonadales bacterium]
MTDAAPERGGRGGGGVAGVVLAAGASTRMGANKMLLELDGEPLVRRTAARALAAGLSPVVVVIGRDAAAVREALAPLAVATVENPDFAGPTGSSLHRGLTALPRDVSGAVVLLGDMLQVTDRMLAAVARTAMRTGAPVVSSRYGDVIAPPLFLRRDLFKEARARGSHASGKRVVMLHRNDAVYVDWPESCLRDVDTRADLEA